MAGLSALKSARRYFVRQIAMEDVSLPTIPQCGAVGIVKGHYGPVLYHAFEVQRSASSFPGEFFRPLPSRGCDCLLLASLTIAFQPNT